MVIPVQQCQNVCTYALFSALLFSLLTVSVYVLQINAYAHDKVFPLSSRMYIRIYLYVYGHYILVLYANDLSLLYVRAHGL